MPLYEYKTDDGRRMLLNRAVDDRDNPIPDDEFGEFKRVPIPEKLRVILGAKQASAGELALKGYHREECRNGSRFRSEFSTKQIKQAWAS